ncbi:hypothetical protein EVJ58_g186 [Rhodofomes roseus]|uniref:Uncharacterized protein n=1 Tax=Rhodofomes roseus TaxID=34475 RepID=A0A4Y9Z7K9_9APHY|nr:hypothetical protein EVJ58_g186 [Rhodofomes roseus]
MAVSEADSGALSSGDGSQTSIYAIDAEAMSVRWRSEPVGGSVHDVRYVAPLDVVVAFGKHHNGDAVQADPFAFVLVLDPATGIQRRVETISHRIHGNPVAHCQLSQKADGGFTVVVVFRDGSTCVTDLKQFLERGFLREGERLVVKSPREIFRVLEAVGVVEQTVIMGTNNGSGSLRTQYVNLE